MSELARRKMAPTDVFRYIIDYYDWLDDQETLSTNTLTAVLVSSPSGAVTVPATINNVSYTPDSKALIFYVNGNSTPAGTVFNVTIQITTVVGGIPPGQTKNDHLVFSVENP